MELLDLLKSEKAKYVKMYNKVKEVFVDDIEGMLEVSNCRGSVQYYHVKNYDGKQVKKYIPTNDFISAQKLANKSYHSKLKSKLLATINQIEIMIEKCPKEDIDSVYYKLSPARKKLVDQVIPTRKQIFDEWYNEKYRGKSFLDDSNLIVTNRGERVRSKSEKILADTFDSFGIKYKYECPLEINNRIFYPDFTFLHPVSLKKIYWEHHGMMDNQLYFDNTIRKIEIYAQSNIIVGKNLILSFESSNHVINFTYVERMIKEFLI